MPESHPYDLPPAEYDAFERACKRHGLHVSERRVREADEGRAVDVRISEVRWA